MTSLLIEIPPRRRLAAGQDAQAAQPAPREWSYLLLGEGNNPSRAGRAATALLPKAHSVVAVLPCCELSWHRVTLPRAAASRMQSVLDGLLEEAVLTDTTALHFALAPRPSASVTASGATWVAAMDKAWLATVLAELEGAGWVVDRLVPAAEPIDGEASEPWGHFSADVPTTDSLNADDSPGEASPLLTLASAQGVCQLPLSGGLPKALLTGLSAPHAAPRYSASPAAAAAAERWLGSAVAVRSDAERLTLAAASDWNLRQFDLVARHRGVLAVRDVWRKFLSPDWRALRWGLAGLVALNVLGLNLWAWEQASALSKKRLAMAELLRGTHPQVRAVLDAPLQMARETQTLRTAAGKPGDGDLEVLLAAAARAWPDGQAPIQNLRFENARLTLVSAGFTPAQLAPLRERLNAIGMDAQLAEGRVTVSLTQPGQATQPTGVAP